MEKIILRICLLSRKKDDRTKMFRIVKTPNHVLKIDSGYLEKGRGAYLSKDKDVIIKAKKRRLLEKSLNVIDAQNIYDELLKLLD